MNAITAAFLEKSRVFFDKAEDMLRSGWADEAGRAAYLASFHAAQALIFECNGRVPKTHSGVRSEFARLAKDDPVFEAEERRFLEPVWFKLTQTCSNPVVDEGDSRFRLKST